MGNQRESISLGFYLNKGGTHLYILIMIMVATVFLGTELLAIPTPGFQLSLYRMSLILTYILTVYQIHKSNPKLRISVKSSTTGILAAYVFWWLWGFLSILWAMSFSHWLRAFFLLSLGVAGLVIIYFWTQDVGEWKGLIKATWASMTLLLIWGYYELLTNHYLFANLAKLDKHNTFASQPLSRIPVTVFENQNDFATMLLAYLVINLILFSWSTRIWQKMSLLTIMALASYLVFRCESRLILFSFILIFFVRFILSFRLDFKFKDYIRLLIFSLIIITIVVFFIPPIRGKLDSLFYIGYGQSLDGDTVRLNLWRNGLNYLGQSFGLGVGAGNIEFWMTHSKELPTKIITNMHNWWLEILVAYGFPVFLAYVWAYASMIYYLFLYRPHLPKQWQAVSNNLLAFLIVYIFASITSANNMLIEWHWVFFALILSYIKITEYKLKAEKEKKYEFINNLG